MKTIMIASVGASSVRGVTVITGYGSKSLSVMPPFFLLLLVCGGQGVRPLAVESARDRDRN